MIEPEIAEAIKRLGQGPRGVEDAVSYSLGHRVRIEIRAALHEGPATASQLAKIMSVPIGTVGYHAKELLKDGIIELAKTSKVGNLDQHYYSVVDLPYFSDEDVAAMRIEDRQALYAMIVQASTAEALASLRAGKMAHDPRVMLAWNRVDLDERGRGEVADEEAASWRRKEDIVAESANRRVKTGERAKTYVIASFCYERWRTSPPMPLIDDAPSEVALANGVAALRQLGKAERSVEDAVSYSLGHRVRIEIRAALHEGPATASRLAKIVRQPRSTVDHHVREMLKDGNLKIQNVEIVGNVAQHYYSVVELPYFSDEDVAAMRIEDRQALYAMIVQASTAEALASLRAGKMAHDPRVMLAWNRVDLDERGRGEIADEEAASWRRKEDIVAESANRCVKTGERAKTYVIASFSYERARTTAPKPLDEGGIGKV